MAQKNISIYAKVGKIWESAHEYKLAWVCFTDQNEFVGRFSQLGAFTKAVIGAKLGISPQALIIYPI